MADDLAEDAAVFILAGGKSTRMGRDKAFVEWNRRTLLARALELARSVTREELVTIIGSREKFGEFAPVVEDEFQGCGPLGGIHAALLASKRELNLMLAVDTPFVTVELLKYLMTQARSATDAVAIVPRMDGHSQPLCAIYRREFASIAEDGLRSGEYKIDALFDKIRVRWIEEKELEGAGFSRNLFRNLNTPEELEAGKRSG